MTDITPDYGQDDHSLLRNAPANSDDWDDATWAAWARTADRAHNAPVEHDAIHAHFGLSYANYLVLPRTLLQSMPDEWQTKFVALLKVMEEAFAHVPQAEVYDVTAGTDYLVADLTDEQMQQLGISGEWRTGGMVYFDKTGREMDGQEYVVVPKADSVPHYNRGRTRVEPKLHHCGNCEGVDPGSCLMNPGGRA